MDVVCYCPTIVEHAWTSVWLIVNVTNRENDITDILDLTFSTEDSRFGETVTIDLKLDGQNIEVTNENKREYVEYVYVFVDFMIFYLLIFYSLVTEWRIEKRVQEQFKNFVDGFHDLIPADLINVFDERELELLIGGIADIDVEDWKKHTDYRGYTESDDVIVNFWKVSHGPFSSKLVCNF